MLLTVYCVRRDLSEITFSLDVDPDFELENFRALCELESGIPAAESLIIYAERPLTDNQRSLTSYGLKDGDVVVLRQKDPTETRPAAQFPGLPRIDFSSIAVPGTSRQTASPQPNTTTPDSTSFPQGLDNPALLREMLLTNPHELSLLKERNPPLAEALLSGDLEKFTKVLLEQQQERARREQERIRLFSADPFDLEAQAKIEEDIRQQNIEENMTIAMEEAPESFGQVVMLYINCKVNGYPVKAFVDSGAQMTIMSQACAERCHIMRLVDRRWAGIAKGVGTQKIIGRVHLAQVQIEGDFLPCSFSILEEQPMDMLLGLDMLKRHQCSIDLEKNVLVIGTTGTRTSFLPEGELPECARLAYGPGREDMRPEEIADRELAEVLQKSAEEADKESTSVEGPSLVPPTDGLHQPVHASGTASTPLAHSISTQISDCSNLSTATESSKPPTNLPKADAVCDGDQSSHHWSGHSVGDDRSTAVPDSPLSNDEGTGSILASSDELADGSVPDLEAEQNDSITKSAESYIHTASHNEQSNLELHTDDLPCSSVSALVYDVDEGQQKMAALCDSAEDTLEVDTETIPYPAIDVECCRRLFTDVAVAGLSELQENAENQPVSSNDMTVDVVSEEVDSTTKQDCPNPANISGQDLQESCFSLATALKELHELLVTSGQGSCRSVADGKAFSESIITDVDQGNNPECSQEGDSNDNYYEIGNEVSLCDENICIKDPEDSMCTETTVSTTDVCSGVVESYVEPSNILGSPLIHTTSPSEVRLSSNGNDVYDGNLPRLSTDPEGLVGEQISSGPQPDPSFSSASAVERIVHAGFSLPDALLALERAEGNVELALLALLAKNIVVPT